MICEWIIIALSEINSHLIKMPFKRCSIFNNLDGMEDDFLFMDLYVEDETIFHNAPKVITEDEYD